MPGLYTNFCIRSVGLDLMLPRVQDYVLFLYRGCGSGWSLTDRGCDPEISLYILGSIAGTLSLSEMSLFWSGGQCVLEAVITQVGMNLV